MPKRKHVFYLQGSNEPTPYDWYEWRFRRRTMQDLQWLLGWLLLALVVVVFVSKLKGAGPGCTESSVSLLLP